MAPSWLPFPSFQLAATAFSTVFNWYWLWWCLTGDFHVVQRPVSRQLNIIFPLGAPSWSQLLNFVIYCDLFREISLVQSYVPQPLSSVIPPLWIYFGWFCRVKGCMFLFCDLQDLVCILLILCTSDSLLTSLSEKMIKKLLALLCNSILILSPLFPSINSVF